MARIVALTTIDNPYSPFDQYEEWLTFDKLHHYDSNELLARFAFYSDELTEEEKNEETEAAIDNILRVDFLKMYKKVEKEVENDDEDDEEDAV